MEVLLVTSSGALSPGPLTIAILREGARKGWKEGFDAALGHVIVEFPLTILLALGASMILSSDVCVIATGILGGSSLLILAALSLLDVLRSVRGVELECREWNMSGVTLGILLSALNPQFLAWWATVGLKIVVDIVAYGGLALLFALYLLHAWVDFTWLTLLAYMSYRGLRFSGRLRTLISALFTVILAYYGISFLANSLLVLSRSQ